MTDPDALARAAVRRAFGRYETALVDNDIPVLDELFWDDARTIRFGATEELFGYDQIREFRAARPSAGLDRSLDRVDITPLGPDHAVANATFRREGVAAVGRQSQVWVRFAGEWQVVSAHVSSRPI
ncbi:oxalurate catabolism protein HpxZ [Streptomyces sp. SID6673]|nr:oxalurate catabolism protein HpxZ [Streptomyces sp. SID11726]NEB25012.1 oxalurate catabolism protein HpxZ [Streptomyces sp. SID6673]